MDPEHRFAKLTYADYVELPDDGLRHEIIDGEHCVTPSPVTQHQRISRNLAYLIQSHLDLHPVGEVLGALFDVILSKTDIVVPDLVYVSNARAHFITSKNLQGAPDLVVEILSPTTRSRDERLKRDLYERAGVEEYWLVDPDQETVQIYRRRGGKFGDPNPHGRGASVTTRLLPGLELPLSKVFGR